MWCISHYSRDFAAYFNENFRESNAWPVSQFVLSNQICIATPCNLSNLSKRFQKVEGVFDSIEKQASSSGKHIFENISKELKNVPHCRTNRLVTENRRFPGFRSPDLKSCDSSRQCGSRGHTGGGGREGWVVNFLSATPVTSTETSDHL